MVLFGCQEDLLEDNLNQLVCGGDLRLVQVVLVAVHKVVMVLTMVAAAVDTNLGNHQAQIMDLAVMEEL